jgi:uncharacterized membrane protein YuzA (DUF378 family)
MNPMEKKYWNTKMYHIVLLLVLIGSFNWGTTALGYNLVDIIKNLLNNALQMETYIDKIIYLLVALAGIKLAMNRDFWLPFLGESVLPGSLVPLKNVFGDTTIEVKVKPNTRVAYWASLPQETDKIPLVHEAYGDFKNAGVVLSNNDGIAKLIVNKGTNYIVPTGREIQRHIHYRELDQVYGMMGAIQTVYY